MSEIKPVTPDEVWDVRLQQMPNTVILAINHLIAENMQGNISVFTAEDVIAEIVAAGDIHRNEIFQRGYLNFEQIYRQVGWKVETDRPGYNETYSTVYTFEKPRKSSGRNNPPM
jgi:hypothetical protein